MSIPTLTGLPNTITAGDTVIFTESFPAYPPGSWTLKLWLSTGVGTPVSIAATTSGTNFLFTITQTISAALAAGIYEYSEVALSADTTQTQTVKQGVLQVLPNFAATQAPSSAQAMVTLYQGVIQEFARTTRSAVNFNGQSYTRANIKDYQAQLVYWEARVLQERRDLNRARGGVDQTRIATRFAPAGCLGPFSVAPWNGGNQ